jgi:hypothetical protein
MFLLILYIIRNYVIGNLIFGGVSALEGRKTGVRPYKAGHGEGSFL